MTTIQWAGGTHNWSVTAAWTGGVVPTAADDVVFTGATTGTLTCDGTSGSPNLCRSLDFTGFTGTFAHSVGVLAIGDGGGGNLLVVGGMTFSTLASSQTRFLSTITGNTITTAGKAFGSFLFNGVGGEWTFQDAVTVNNSGVGITLTNGSLIDNGKAVSSPSFLANNTNTCSINFSGSWSGITTWTINPTNKIITVSNCTITPITNVAFNMTGGGQHYKKLDMTSSHGGFTKNVLDGGNTFDTLTMTLSTNEYGFLNFSGDQTITTLTLTGNQAAQPGRLYVSSNTKGTARSITSNFPSISNTDFQDITAVGSNWVPQVGTTIGDCGGNTNIAVTTGLDIFWVASGSGSWSQNHWFTTSGGITPARQPLPQDLAIFDKYSNIGAGNTITVDVRRVSGMNFDGTAFGSSGPILGIPTLNFPSVVGQSIFGDVVLYTAGAGMSLTGTNQVTFEGRGSQVIKTYGNTWTMPTTLNNVNGTYTQQDNFSSNSTANNGTISSAFAMLSGNWNTGTYTFTLTGSTAKMDVAAGTFTSGGTVLISGTSTANLTITGGNVNAAGQTVQINGTGSTVTFTGGTLEAGTFTRTGLSTTIAGTVVTLGAGGMTGAALTVTSGGIVSDGGALTLTGAFTLSGGNNYIGLGGATYTSYSFTGGSDTINFQGIPTITGTALTEVPGGSGNNGGVAYTFG